MATGFQVTFDAHDPARLAEFWANALGYVRQQPPPGFGTWAEFAAHIGVPPEQADAFDALVDPDGAGPRLFFQRVPEDKTAKNRVHLDVNVGAGITDQQQQQRSVVRDRAQQLVAAGASLLREVDEPHGWCLTMTDPEGNEFCVQ